MVVVVFAFLFGERSGGASTLPPWLAYSSGIASVNVGTPHKKHNNDHECKILEVETTHFLGGGGGGKCSVGLWRVTEEVGFYIGKIGVEYKGSFCERRDCLSDNVRKNCVLFPF